LLDRANLVERIEALIGARRAQDADYSARAGAWLSQLRRGGLPQPRDEAWRYAPIRGAEKLIAAAPQEPAHQAPDSQAVAALLPARATGFSRLVLVDGAISSLSDDAARRTLTHSAPVSTDELGNNGFALVNQLLNADPVELRLGAEFATRLQVVYVNTSTQRDRLAPSALRVAVASRASVELVEQHLSLPGAAAGANHVVDVNVAAGATLCWTRLLTPDVAARHIETLRLESAAESLTQLTQILPGNNALRSTVVAALAGAGAQLDFDSVALGDGNQQVDQHVLIDHRAPAAKSRETFRGLAAGRARVSFTGHNRVQPAATQADSRQSLRSLLLSADAEAVARPQLEILTDAVQATHGATVGTLDPQMLFYLLSRGLDRNTAQSLLKWTFLQEVVAKISQRELRNAVETVLLARLGDSRLAEFAP
jgi:Fe-S cluster assembly protein SufD